MKIFQFILVITSLFALLLIYSCGYEYREGYRKGYDEGREEGIKTAEYKGKLKWYSEGYNQGYMDSKNGKSINIPVVKEKIKEISRFSLRGFAKPMYFINALIFISIIVYLVIISEHPRHIIGKIMFIMMSAIFGLFTLHIIDLNFIIQPDISKTARSILSFIIGPFIFLIFFAFYRMIHVWDQLKMSIIAIIMLTFFTVHYSYMIMDLEVFIANNQFISNCILSSSFGAFAFLGYVFLFGKPFKQLNTIKEKKL